ncbi:MAG: carbon-nitrogen hydrolase family protein [Micrococcaceae bacterium]|uniref:carbon-nitrogen hydrolase family protein n=1 Tax=Arthrobacter sp. 179 TaxID=3457734 RepID=UPI00264F545A|nr:carbon-nitrogen hydrolase family protein [Micrococcaceae bacterium]MDN5813252.1 carbon-nitrogen hydrolase family protein [Micrococcaceae bacterium]MDN5880267.1 carbon-nitrogen hydrolase family protein [Micrococcaceae bacterium]MDN5887685.1 carbon-nitrogen hydrolase family protein [Micrococcaceae bacterium]
MKIALAQINSTADLEANLGLVRDQAARARDAGAAVVVFPEATMCAFGNPLAEVAQPLDGDWARRIRALSAELGIVTVHGMFTPGEDGRVRNTLLATGPGVEASYDKIHLYDAYGFAESDAVTAGGSIATFELDGVVFGLSICYDVRFPDLFRANAAAGATVNLVCASWGDGPDKAEQWEALIRARALDTTTFIVACDQADPAASGRPATDSTPLGVGRSAVISPLGRTLACLPQGPELTVVDLDLAEVEQARRKLPVLANARRIGPDGRVVAPGATEAEAG